MATPELAIAKAALSACLFRADPSSISRPAVDGFFALVAATAARCSRDNVQKCKAWIVDHVAPSPARAAALGKFLVALSKNEVEGDGRRPSARRRRLHLLYIVNDVLHHVVVRQGNAGFARTWEPYLPALVASAGAFDKCPKHKSKLEDLVSLWSDKKYLSSDMIAQLKEAIKTGSAADLSLDHLAPTPSLKLAKDAPFLIPSMHGDSSTPWYDLPAATWFPHLTPNSTKPMLPDLIRPIHLAPGPANKALTDAVQTLLADVETLFAKEKNWNEDPFEDLDELGEKVVIDEISGETVGGETYYGWSRQFCDEMKKRRERIKRGDLPISRSPSRSRSRSPRGPPSRSPSSPAFKRPRTARSRSRSRARSHGRGRSYSRSRSPDPGNRSHRYRPNNRSPSPQRNFRQAHHDHSYAPPRGDHRQPPPPPPGMPPLPLPGDFPVPPPPAGYQGPWPPPPPPPGAIPPGWIPNLGMVNQMRGAWPPPQPQPPSHGYNNHGRGNGGGGGGFRGRGRGGYDRGRGW